MEKPAFQQNVPIWHKSNLSVIEASAYFGIGEGKLRSLIRNPKCKYVLMVGTKTLIRREKFEKILDKAWSI